MLNLRVFSFCVFSWLALYSRGAYCQSEFATGERFTEETVVEGVPISTAVAFAPESRMFLALKEGIVRVVQDGKLLERPFVDLSAIVNKQTDRGLLGIAVDPNFPLKPYVYLSYVYDPPGYPQDTGGNRLIRVVRFVADAAFGYNVAIPGSEEIILGNNSKPEFIAGPIVGDPTSPEPASCRVGLTMAGAPIQDCIPCDSTSHTAGTLLFGADGFLYASLGDGANYDRPSQVSFNAQDLDAMSGRVVRVDPNTGDGVSGNPFFDPNDPGSNRSRVWSHGYRNPFRITINPTNGEVFAGDVGTSYYEEINAGKGGNFGWPCYEGGFTDRAQQEGVATWSEKQVGFKKAPLTIDFCTAMYVRGSSKVRAPLFTYRHPYDANGKDLGSSITGLAFYSGDTYPEKYKGALFFADYARKFIRYLTFDSTGKPTAHDFAKEVGSNFGAVQLINGPDRNLYAVYLDLKTKSGTVRRFKPITGSNTPPSVTLTANPIIGTAPLVVQFSSVGSNDPDGQGISYKWSFGDGKESTEANPVHVYTTVGTFPPSLTVSETSAPFASSKRSLTVRTGRTPPAAFIDEPGADVRYEIGRRITFSGHAEPSTGVTMTWSLLQRHNQHEHLITEVSGLGGSFVPEEHCDNCGYELCLRAEGEGGLIDQKCQSVAPLTTPYTFASDPPGASITYIDEEKEVLAPYVALPIVGSGQTISAAVVSNGRSFARWNDGGVNPVRSFITGQAPQVLTAVYVNKPPRVAVRVSKVGGPKSRRVRFDASNSKDPEGEPLTYTWRFADRRVGSGPATIRNFNRLGNYSVVLTVSDRLGGVTVYRAALTLGRSASIRRIAGRRVF
jgi:glucose/arabinose dehydrogenase